jgi:hypothetical protein
MRRCGKCKEIKELSDFSITTRKLSDGTKVKRPYSYCKPCRVKVNSENFKKLGMPRCKTTQKDYKLRTKYNITLSDFHKQMEFQSNVCAICKCEFQNERKTHVDHCHTTGEIRGILCSHCNHALGMFKDDINIIQTALDYIKNKGSWFRGNKKLTSDKSEKFVKI